MRGAVAGFLTLLVLAPTQPHAEALAELEAAQTALYERIAPGIAVVTRSGAVGAAFAVAPGLLLTAGHVVGDEREVDVGLRDGRTVRGVVVERGADGLDVALVRIPADPPVLPLAPSALLRPGSIVATIGHPDGNRFVLATGLVAQAPDDAASAALVRLQLPLRAGASGGPVVDRSGRVVGVVALGAAGTVTFAVRAEAAVRALPGLSAVPVSEPPPALAQGATPADALPLAGSASSPVPPRAAPLAEEERPALAAPVLVTGAPDQARTAPRARAVAARPLRVEAPVLVVAPAQDPQRLPGGRPQAHGRALHAAALRPAPELPGALAAQVRAAGALQAGERLRGEPAAVPVLAGASLALAALGVALALALRDSAHRAGRNARDT